MFLTSWIVGNLDSYQLVFNVLTGLILFWFVTYLLPKIKRVRSLPPGPWGLPAVGYLPFLKKYNEHEDLDRLAKKYGPVYSLSLGKDTVVVVNDWNHAKEVFKNDDLLDRPEGFANNRYGVSFIQSSGEHWRAHRRLSLHLLHDLGLDKSSFDDKIKNEINQFLPKLGKGPVENLYKAFLSTVTNTISFLLLGHGFEDDDPVKQTLIDTLMVASQVESPFGIYSSGLSPKIEGLLMKPKIKLEAPENYHEKTISLQKYIQIEIDQHKKKQSKEVVDYIAGYLQEQKNRKDNLTFDDETLRANIISLYEAGSETVATALTWAILYLIQNPEYYGKIRGEISDVIGFERLPEYSDRIKMPVTMSFIFEVYRIASLIPVNLFRVATRDVKIGKFNVPKDTHVMVNFWTINHDTFLWIKPYEFDPTRFFTDHGAKSVKPPFLTPFSGGARGCPGEGLANVEIFLYLVSIVQKYKIECKPGSELSFEAEYGSIRRPKSIPPLIFTQI